MTRPRSVLCALLLIATTHAFADAPADRHFLDKVKPLLDSRCVSCHGPDKVKGGLRLDSRAATLRGGETGPGVVPGKPGESLVLLAVSHKRADLEMPPKEKLTAQDVAVLERWIVDGAPWPESKPPVPVATTQRAPAERIGDAWSDPRNPVVRIFGGQRLDLWSLKPVRPVAPPAVKDAAWPRGAIDQFVLAKLEAAGLSPAREADKRQLIRRLTFDLTGLPPTHDEVRAFVADPSPDAYERLVDRLLASPRYGEHAARLWLDVVRYSDSNGFDWDEFRKEAWQFRDYVVRSMNADKPFDQFVREQLAGDELTDGPPKTQAEQDAMIATGYLRLGPHDNAAPLFNEQARSRAELMFDLVDTTGSAFLGLAMSCCRCHDHKYDPISQADYFRMRAFFEGVKFSSGPIDLAAEQAAIAKHNEPLDAQVKTLQAKRDALKKATTKEDKAEADLLGRMIDDLKKMRRNGTAALLMTDGGTTSPPTKILFAGDYKQERDVVEPGFLSALDPNAAAIARPANSKTTGRRLTLANWIASADNPLTARVVVNRAWQQHFGRGLVATPNDFGLAGRKPTHPELLDYLASQFVKDGWSLKRLHRAIVTSAAYRQTSTFDPTNPAGKADAENALLWRQNLRRLSAEQLRDALLATSGLLLDRAGGPPVWPELPAEIAQANPAFLDDNAEKTKGWYPSPVGERNVRSVYLVQKRTVKVPLLETFDLPDNAASCARRDESTVAPQALALMNGPLTAEAARAMAKRIDAADDAARVRAAFQHALQRNPDDGELRACVEALKSRSLVELCRALLNVNEFVYVD